jgi:hypothetical protein
MTESSDTVFIITEKRDLIPVFKYFAEENRIKVPEPENNLTSVEYIREKTTQNGGLSWIKKDIIDYIKSKGYPLLIIIDMKINSGTDDNDSLRVLKTILLSFALITHSESFRDVICSLFILSEPSDYLKFNSEVKDPKLLFGNIKTGDNKVNQLIDRLKTDAGLFNRNFNIFISSTGNGGQQITSELKTFYSMIKAREKLRSKLNKPAAALTPENSSAAPADIIFRMDNGYYLNGEFFEKCDYCRAVTSEEIYIIGNFTSFTRVEVIERLLKLIKSGPTRDYSFRKNPDIIIHIPEESTIDVTIPVTLAQLMSKEFSDFRNMKIKTTMKHTKTMEQSKGYSMIQRSIILSND